MAIAAVQGARAAGATVVFTNGVFDLLHPGHLRYLQRAKALGDVLIVGVNSDRSVRPNKGPARPITPEDERAEILAALAAVDHVVVFDEDTADRLVSLIRPHVHAKGTDYTAASVPESAAVSAVGGRVAIVGDPKDHATGDLIALILERFARDG